MTQYERNLLDKFYRENPTLQQEEAERKLADVKEANRVLAWATCEMAFILAKGDRKEAVKIIREATGPPMEPEVYEMYKALINQEFERLASKKGFLAMCKNATKA